MSVNLSALPPADLHPVAGLSLGTAMAGVRKANRRDLTVVAIDPGASVAGVFTANRFCAAPVQLCREHLAAGGEVTIRRERLNGARQAFWFDPRTGERFACEVGERIVAPDGRDWVWVATD